MTTRGAPGETKEVRRDFEGRERLVSRLREANSHLVMATIDAQTLTEAAARLNLRQEQFLATLAHELRNPLAPIRTANAVLGLVAGADPRVKSVHEIIDRQVKHMARLLDDLLDMARMKSGKIELRRRAVTIRECVEQAVETCGPLMEERGQGLTIDIPEQPFRVDGDPVRLAQVFSNLLHNASKYTQIDGAIALTARLEGDGVVVSVKDNGIGIAPELLPDVFELFAQGAHLDDRAQSGLGIGLTVVRHMVEMHGGAVRASSAGLGRGSEFVVTLPLLRSDATVATPEHPEEGASTRRRSCRIVLIDDSADAVASLQMLLEFWGHEVSTASDGISGVAAILANRPEIVVCDIGLPDLDGFSVASRVRAQMKDEMPLMIALTGYGQDADRNRALAAGFDHHLVKPVDPETLLQLFSRGKDPG